jgi:hypothetical protein
MSNTKPGTRANAEKHFDRLARRIKPGDSVYLWKEFKPGFRISCEGGCRYRGRTWRGWKPEKQLTLEGGEEATGTLAAVTPPLCVACAIKLERESLNLDPPK